MEESSVALMQFFIEQKMESLRSIQSTGMLWWASSVVFCSSLVGTVWYHREKLASLPILTSLGKAINFFLFTVIGFGILMVIKCMHLRSEILTHPNASNYPKVNSFSTDFEYTAISYLIATSSFILIFICWFKLLRYIRKLKPNENPNIETRELQPIV